jgi:hypothetical protein
MIADESVTENLNITNTNPELQAGSHPPSHNIRNVQGNKGFTYESSLLLQYSLL